MILATVNTQISMRCLIYMDKEAASKSNDKENTIYNFA